MSTTIMAEATIAPIIRSGTPKNLPSEGQVMGSGIDGPAAGETEADARDSVADESSDDPGGDPSLCVFIITV